MTKVYHYQFPLALKTCSKCHQEKPIEAFHRANNQSSGYRSACKECLKKQRPKRPPRPLIQLSMLKICNVCAIEKSISDFEKGVAKCKVCRNEQRYKRVKWQVESGDIPTTRICRICQQEKPIEQFYKSRLAPNGYSRECKACNDTRKRAWVTAHPEKVRMQKMRNYDPEEKRQYNQTYYQINRDPMNDYSHHYYEQNRAKLREKGKEWQQANLLKCKEYNDRRRAIKRQATVEKVSYERILERDQGWCYICEKPIRDGQKINFDHVIPLERGGAHNEQNIKLTHATCNNRKRFRLIEEMTAFQRRGIE